ncbi:MAG: ABC transporter permease [Acidimicrobiales bacterium]
MGMLATVSMFGLALGNLWTKKGRSILLALAIAVAVMTVVTLTVVSQGLESSAAAVLTIGRSNFTVAQKGVSDILYSSLDERQLSQVRSTPGVASAVGVLLETEKINAANPLFLEIGIPPADLTPFGVTVVAGHPYAADASHQMMMGWRAAQNFGVHVGSLFHANGTTDTVVGIYSTGISFGDLGAMFPLPAIQAYNRVPGAVTLAFVKTAPHASIPAVERHITDRNPELTTIGNASQFGRADQNLIFLQAAATGSTILAIVIGAIIVGNAMLLSLFERTREFGLLRAVGWSRSRVVILLLFESIVLGLIGAGAGIGLSYLASAVLQSLPQLRGVLHSSFTAGAFARGLYTGLGMTVIGTLYPALRAAFLSPLKALSHE